MIFDENCLLADNSHQISYHFFSKIKKDVANFVVCCSRDWRFKGKNESKWHAMEYIHSTALQRTAGKVTVPWVIKVFDQIFIKG